jgi:hypothetical protein
MNNISDTKKPCPTTNLNKVYLCPKGLQTMHTIASLEPEPQEPKKFRKDNMQADLHTTATKLDEMANLFSIIKSLIENKGKFTDQQVKQLAETGMYICEDWSDQVTRMETLLTQEHKLYYH